MGLEQKSDTLFEIINNVVKELTSLKQTMHSKESHYPIHQIPISPFYNDLGGNHLSSNQVDVQDELVEQYNAGDGEGADDDDDETDYDEGECEGETYDSDEDVDLNFETKAQETSEEEDSKQKEKEELLKIIKLELNQEEGEPTEEEPVVVHKIDENSVQNHEDYNKLTTHQLKTMVLSKGLSTDVKNLRRNQLLGLLETR